MYVFVYCCIVCEVQLFPLDLQFIVSFIAFIELGNFILFFQKLEIFFRNLQFRSAGVKYKCNLADLLELVRTHKCP